MSRLKASTILSRSTMAWLEKLFINFSAHLSSGRCDSPLSRSLSCDFLGWQHCHRFQYNHMLFSLCDQWNLCDHTENQRILADLPAVLITERIFQIGCHEVLFPFVNTMGVHDYNNWNTFICIWVLSSLCKQNPPLLSCTLSTSHNQSSAC